MSKPKSWSEQLYEFTGRGNMTPYILYIAIIFLHVPTFTFIAFLISYGNDPLHTTEKKSEIYIYKNRIFSNTCSFSVLKSLIKIFVELSEYFVHVYYGTI